MLSEGDIAEVFLKQFNPPFKFAQLRGIDAVLTFTSLIVMRGLMLVQLLV